MAPPTPPYPPFPSFSGKGDGASPSDPPAALLPSHVAPDSSGIHPPPCKRVKVEEVPHHSPASAEPSPALCGWEDVPPLNLKLSVTPSFLELVELSRASTQNTVAGSPAMAAAMHCVAVVDRNKEKQKATNFSASLLKIGSWEV